MNKNLVVSSSCLVLTEEGQIVANLIPQTVPELRISMAEATEYAKLFAKAPQMEDICKHLALLLPAQKLEELDAADFKDRAREIFDLVLEARKVLGVEPMPDDEDPED